VEKKTTNFVEEARERAREREIREMREYADLLNRVKRDVSKLEILDRWRLGWILVRETINPLLSDENRDNVALEKIRNSDDSWNEWLVAPPETKLLPTDLEETLTRDE
jgi:hypothetical protein